MTFLSCSFIQKFIRMIPTYQLFIFEVHIKLSHTDNRLPEQYIGEEIHRNMEYCAEINFNL